MPIPSLWPQSIPGRSWSDKKAQGSHNVPGKGVRSARGHQEHNSICREVTWRPPPWVAAPRVAGRSRGQSLGVSVLVWQASCSREHWSHPCPCCASTANRQSPGLLHRVRHISLSSGRGMMGETRQREDTAAQGPQRGRDTDGHERQSRSKRALLAGVSICSEPLPHAGDAVLLMCRLQSAWNTSPEKPPQKVLAEHQGESHGAAPAIGGSSRAGRDPEQGARAWLSNAAGRLSSLGGLVAVPRAHIPGRATSWPQEGEGVLVRSTRRTMQLQ